MGDKIRKSPNIRFVGFTDDWEQRKLGDVFAQKVNYVDPIKEMIELWSLTVEKGLTPKTERYNREALVKKNDKFKVVHPGDIVYNPMNMTIGAVGFNNSSKSVAVSGYYVTMNMKTGFDNKFFNTWLPSPNALNLYKNYATGSLIEKQRVQFPTLSGIKLDIPKLDEQIKIGSFFAKIDNLITLHQRKLELLKVTKKSMLQKMFPKDGESIPEIRFAGFTDAWEQRKVGELVNQVIREVDKPDKPYWRLSVRSHAKGTFHQFVDEPQKVAMDKLYVVHEDDLVVNITFAWEHAIAVASKEDTGMLVSHRFPMYRADGKSDIGFLKYLVSQEYFRRKMDLISPGGAGRNRVLSKSEFLKIEVVVPCNKEEQQKIGEYFSNLDNLITLHQRELDLLKDLKKSMLQQMFI